MGVREYNEARASANARYDAKTYKKVQIALRLDEDADILESMEEAKEHGYTLRQWLRQLYEGK